MKLEDFRKGNKGVFGQILAWVKKRSRGRSRAGVRVK
jgi:hypothetical protein